MIQMAGLFITPGQKGHKSSAKQYDGALKLEYSSVEG